MDFPVGPISSCTLRTLGTTKVVHLSRKKCATWQKRRMKRGSGRLSYCDPMNWVIVGTLAAVVLVIGLFAPGGPAGLIRLLGILAVAGASVPSRRQRTSTRHFNHPWRWTPGPYDGC